MQEKSGNKPWWIHFLNTGLIAATLSILGLFISSNHQQKQLKLKQMEFKYGLLKDYLSMIPDDTKKQLMFDYMVLAFTNKIDSFANKLVKTEKMRTEINIAIKNKEKELKTIVDAEAIKQLKEKLDSLKKVKDQLDRAADYYREQPFSYQEDFPDFGVDVVKNVKTQFLKDNPELQDKTIALYGFEVTYGDIVNSITPIYCEIGEDLNIKNVKEGDKIGGEGGDKTRLENDGYIVTGLNIERGYYFGREEVVHFQVVWNKLTPQGIDPSSIKISEKLGSGNNATDVNDKKVIKVNDGNFISNFSAEKSVRTNGDVFFHNISVEQEKVPISKIQ